MSKHAASTRSTARARVYRRKERGKYIWVAEVIDSTGKVVWSDDTGGRNARVVMLDDAAEMVTAVRRIENAGHRLALSWREVVDACLGVA